jgi:hypothetical protein
MISSLGCDRKSSIAILIPYFGKWPFWISLFVESCKKNIDIDWFLFGDCGPLECFSENVKYVNIEFREYKSLVSKKLNMNFDPDDAYKFCDIKPALGLIHEEFILDYDFWGFGDLDLVYGDLRALYTEEYLDKYDLYSNHATRVSGHLCLIRNTEKMRNIFKKIPDWKNKFANPAHMAIDEKAFSKLFVKHKNLPGGLRNILRYVYRLSRKSDFIESYTTPNGCIAWRDGSYNFPKKWFWKDGLITNDLDRKYYPYFHFAIWKKNDWLKNEVVQVENINANLLYEFSSEGIRTVDDLE